MNAGAIFSLVSNLPSYVVVVDLFVYIRVQTPYFAGSVKTATSYTTQRILAPDRKMSKKSTT